MNQGIELTPHSISILYKALARSSIEYGLTHYYPYDTKGKMKVAQNNFLRLITNGMKNTPIKAMELISNTEPIQIRYEQLCLRKLARIYHTDNYHPITKTYDNYIKKKTLINSQFYRKKNLKSNKDNTYSNLKKNSIFIASNLAQNIKEINIFNVDYNKVNKQQITANPTYNISKLPTNFNVITEPANPDIKIIENNIKIYTDGSCIPNPGKGASALYIPKQNTHPTPKIIMFKFEIPVSITITEASATSMVMNHILNSNWNKNTQINIYIDNLSILQFLKFECYPKYNNIKLIIESILIKLKQIKIKYPTLHITFYKIKAHSGNVQNGVVDKIARNAASKVKYIPDKYKNIAYQTSLTQIHKNNHENWSNCWKFNKNPSFENIFLFRNTHNAHRKIHKLTKYINHHKLGIITRLITQHIELNHYLHYKIKPDHKKYEVSPICPNCSSFDEETVQHFILECKHYHHQRIRMFNALSKIWEGFEIQSNRTLDQLIFPFINCNDDGIHIEIQSQANIWRSVLKYIFETKRFQDTELYNIDMLKTK